jgi:hypothetical protein
LVLSAQFIPPTTSASTTTAKRVEIGIFHAFLISFLADLCSQFISPETVGPVFPEKQQQPLYGRVF